jgi:uncharacterized membrane protein
MRLPLQNVFSVAALIVCFSLIIEVIGVQTSLPFGSYVHTETVGPRVFGLVAWPAPLIWLVIVLNARGVARLVLRPWRKFHYYGLWVIGLSALLVVTMNLAAQPFASRVLNLWMWQTPITQSSWHHVPWTAFIGEFAVTICILAFATPWLINKQPSRQPPDWHPLIMWGMLEILFATGNALHSNWAAVMASAVATTALILFAWRGARW